jgi:hypothetical protein
LPGGVADHQGLASATVGVPTVLLLRLRCDGLPDHQTRDLHLLAVVAVVLALEAADVDEPLAVGIGDNSAAERVVRDTGERDLVIDHRGEIHGTSSYFFTRATVKTCRSKFCSGCE